MTSRERVLTSLNHKTPDKVPLDLGGSPTTGIHISCVEKLREYYGLKKEPIKMIEPFQCLGNVDDDLAKAMGTDVDGVVNASTMMGTKSSGWKEWRAPWGQTVLVGEGFVTTSNDKGETFFYPEGDLSAGPSAHLPEGGWFFDAIIRQPPLPEDEDLVLEDNLEEFGVISDASLAFMKPQVEASTAANRATFAFFGGTGLGDIALVPGMHMKKPKGIRDVTEWYVSTLTRTDFIRKIFEREIEMGLASLERVANAFGDKIDVVLICGTDFGTQSSTFCGPETFKDLYMPFYKKVNGWIHANTKWKTFKHSCGSIPSFMPFFIESGFDIINPVQVSAAGMDARWLKKEFGKDISFWGGGVNTQKTLPFGTPQEVREEVLERLEIFSPDGGFIFNSIHNVQARTPLENIIAMIDAVKEFNGVK